MATIKSSDENTEQANVSLCVMYVIYVMWMAAFLVVMSSKPTATENETDIVTEIQRVIGGREEMRTVVSYLNSSRDELVKEMPLFHPDGTKLNYTFFAPTSLAFMLQTADDTAHRLFADATLRFRVLIRHFAKQSVSPNDLTRLDRLVMADSKVAAITRSADTKTFVDGVEIQTGAIPLPQSFGVVYIVDQVFMNDSEVKDAIGAYVQSNAAITRDLPIPPSVSLSPVDPDAIAIEQPSASSSRPIVAGFNRASPSEIDVDNVTTFVTTSFTANVAPTLVLVNAVKAETQAMAAGQIIDF